VVDERRTKPCDAQYPLVKIELWPNSNEESTYQLQSEVVVYGDLNVLLRPQIPFGRLDGGMAEQEFDLLQIPAVLPAEFGAGAAQVVGAEALDPDLLR
jgi:hypothetical protein